MAPQTSLKAKARRLLEEGRVRKELDTGKRAHFAVEGETEDHSVILNKTKGRYLCDCKYSSLQERDCSHIAACRMLQEGTTEGGGKDI